MAATLTTAAVMTCPHGGTVTATTTNLTTAATGAKLLTIADTFTVSGCAFTLPGPKPSPCIRVQWIVSDVRVRVGGNATLSQSSVGLCFSPESIPQGTVVISTTQPRVAST